MQKKSGLVLFKESKPGSCGCAQLQGFVGAGYRFASFCNKLLNCRCYCEGYQGVSTWGWIYCTMVQPLSGEVQRAHLDFL